MRQFMVYFVLGGPGCGKGTQCELMSLRLKFKHLSVGQLLRDAIDKNSKHKQQIQEVINSGKIVPV
ncbi:hypothetical protein pb186bvf_013065 [Paramecium bursaria]